jgi:hypothetical protein
MILVRVSEGDLSNITSESSDLSYYKCDVQT